MSDYEDRQELEALDEELQAHYDKIERYQKDATAMRKRADALDELAAAEILKARTVKAERDALRAHLRMAELERELTALKTQYGVTGEGHD